MAAIISLPEYLHIQESDQKKSFRLAAQSSPDFRQLAVLW